MLIWLPYYPYIAADSGLSRSDLLNYRATTPTGALNATTSSFTPPSNSLLVVSIGHMSGSVGASGYPTNVFTVTGGGLTWTKRSNYGFNDNPSGYSYAHELWTAPVATGASMTINVASASINNSDSTCPIFVQVSAYTGYNTSTPIGGYASGNGLGNGAAAITLNVAPTVVDVVHGNRYAYPASSGDAAATPYNDITEIYDNQAAAANYGALQTQARSSGNTSTSWGYSDIATIAVTRTSAMAIVIKAA